MDISESQAFSNMITDALAYWKQDASKFTINVWWQGCKPFTLEQVSKALTAHATDPDKGQFPPKVADIVRHLAGTKTDRSLLAWGKVYDAMASVGAYQDVDFGDGAIHATIIDMGGWPKMCRTESDELSYLQHRFCESYRAYQTAGTTEIPYLIGDRSPDEMYLKRGLPVPKPVQIGEGKSLPKVSLTALQRTAMEVIPA